MKGQAGDRVAGNQAPEDRLGHERAAPCSRTDAELRSFGGARFSPRAAAPRRRSVGEALFDSSRVMPCDVFIPCQPAGMELGISDSCDFACSRPAVRSSGDGPLGSRSSGECIWRRSFFARSRPRAGTRRASRLSSATSLQRADTREPGVLVRVHRLRHARVWRRAGRSPLWLLSPPFRMARASLIVAGVRGVARGGR